ncbi:hypothetical protein [Lentzea sp. NBRC 102530]|uniref:hypothetical protein n=1 Tax=Lentzea sp. NBRC 102530 TaxID=3032201 RepID=UPI00255374EC|nr:hypothetical protein [Lentzea sp. NBRC 102530]
MSSRGAPAGNAARLLDVTFPYFMIEGVENPWPPRPWPGEIVSASAGALRFQLPDGARTATLTVETFARPPGCVAEDFDDVVEVGYRSRTGEHRLLDWAHRPVCDLGPLLAGPGGYRVRYHVREVRFPRGAELRPPGVDVLLRIWPAAPGEPVAVKITSDWARCWRPARS